MIQSNRVLDISRSAHYQWDYLSYLFKAAIYLLLFLLSISSFCQQLELVSEVAIATPTSVSLDRYNHIFVADAKGNVTQYDENGKSLLRFSPSRVSGISLIEAWKSVQLFVFYRDFQQYTFLDRFLSPLQQSTMDENVVGFARIATVSSDDNLWIFDDTDFSLKKYDLQSQSITIHSPLGLVLDTKDYDITFMREYQNMLLISDRNTGILVFDNLGNYKKKLPFKGLAFFGLLNEELYFTDESQVRFFHLYNLTERTIALPKASASALRVLAFDDKLALLYKEKLVIYRIKK